jgi:hypothetical protein
VQVLRAQVACTPRCLAGRRSWPSTCRAPLLSWQQRATPWKPSRYLFGTCRAAALQLPCSPRAGQPAWCASALGGGVCAHALARRALFSACLPRAARCPPPTHPHALAPQEVTDTKPWGSRCVFRRFDNQTHGFCAARGDWSQPGVAAAATEAISILAGFFTANLLQADT